MNNFGRFGDLVMKKKSVGATKKPLLMDIDWSLEIFFTSKTVVTDFCSGIRFAHIKLCKFILLRMPLFA